MTQNDENYTSEFRVAAMDCPSEIALIRTGMETLQPEVILDFDIPDRKVTVLHSQPVLEIQESLVAIGLGGELLKSITITSLEREKALASVSLSDAKEAKALKFLLLINASMFVLEGSVGLFAQSSGLISDSLDMFADAGVYGVALYAVSKSSRVKGRATHLAGILQLLLALGAIGDVLRRFMVGSEPVSLLMMVMGGIALIANITCLFLLHDSKDGGSHMKASWIFSTNDVIVNAGVIVAGLAVLMTESRYPDLMIGLIVGLVVLNGARRILALSRK